MVKLIKKSIKEDLTKKSKAVIGEKLQKIKDFEKKFKDRWEIEGDLGYYFTICFKTGAERDAFLKETGIRLKTDDHVFMDDLKTHFKKYKILLDKFIGYLTK